MTWNEHHTESERLASAAEVALRQGHSQRARELYRKSAEEESLALAALDPAKTRTLGVTAVSAISLYYKAADHNAALDLGRQCLANGHLPPFAREQIQTVLDLVDSEQRASSKRSAMDSDAVSMGKGTAQGQSVAQLRSTTKKEGGRKPAPKTGRVRTKLDGIAKK
ncbi:MAG: hypothetical protein ACREAC_03425 [Blastocatellia bacterium]